MVGRPYDDDRDLAAVARMWREIGWIDGSDEHTAALDPRTAALVLDLTRRLLGLPTREIDRVLEITEMTAHGRRRVADY